MSVYSTAATATIEPVHWHPQVAYPGVDDKARSRGKLLIVSAPDDQLFSLLKILGQTDYHLLWRPNGEEAKKMLRKDAVPVVLCAQHLWQGTWVTLLEHVQRLHRRPRFVLTTGLADDHLWVDALSLGAYDILVKPFDAEEVLRIIHGAFQGWPGE